MGQATRTTKLLLDLDNRRQGGANTGKRAALDATVGVLNEARAFYIDFLLAHTGKLAERIPYYSEQHLEMRERAISALMRASCAFSPGSYSDFSCSQFISSSMLPEASSGPKQHSIAFGEGRHGS